jgi:hypothetical protein
MAGTGGKREGAGRKKGSVSKKTQSVVEKMEALGCDPLEAMHRIAQQAEKGIEEVDRDGNIVIRRDMALAGQMYKELAQYVAPKRKAVEVSGTDGDAIQHELSVNITGI